MAKRPGFIDLKLGVPDYSTVRAGDLTWADVESAPEDMRDKLGKAYAEQMFERAAATEADDPPPVRIPSVFTMTAEEKEAAGRFDSELRTDHVPYQGNGVNVSWDHFDAVRKKDPKGFAAWSLRRQTLTFRQRSE